MTEQKKQSIKKQIPVYQMRNGKAERLPDMDTTDDLIEAVFMVQVPPDIPVKDMMHFWVPAQPLEVPPELLALPPDECIVLRIGQSTQHICHAYGCANTIEEIINRQAKGLFTLVEVADILADMRKAEPKRIRITLESAFMKSELTIRDPDDLIPIVPPDYAAPHLVTTPDDVDRWLTNTVNAPYRFPRIASADQPTTPPAPPVVADSAPGGEDTDHRPVLKPEEEPTPNPAPDPQAAPIMAVGASDGSPLATVSAWKLIQTPKRLPGYRWPLYQFLEAALTAGQPCPKAQHVLDAWKLTPPNGLRVIQLPRRDELEYELETGAKKPATAKQIQAVIKGLLSE